MNEEDLRIGFSNTYDQLNEVMLYAYSNNPFKEGACDWRKVNEDLYNIARKLQELGINVRIIDLRHIDIDPDRFRDKAALINQRDLFIPKRFGIFIAKPYDEHLSHYEAEIFMASKYPVQTSETSINYSNVIFHNGEIYSTTDIRNSVNNVIPVVLTNHIFLRDAMTFVAKNKVIVRTEHIDIPENTQELEIIELKETEEVTNRGASGILVVKENEIIMPRGCPETKQLYENSGITVHCVNVNQLHDINTNIDRVSGVLSRGV